MKTFKKFYVEWCLNEETNQQRIDRQNQKKFTDAQRLREFGREAKYDRAHRLWAQQNPKEALRNARIADRVRKMQQKINQGGPLAQNPGFFSGVRGESRPPVKPPPSAPVNNIGAGVRVVQDLLKYGSNYALGPAVILNTSSQEKDAARYQRVTGGVRPGERYKASDVDSRGIPKPGAISPLTTLATNKVISDVGGKGGKVTTNKPYEATVGGFRKGSSTRIEGGKRILQVDMGAKLPKDKPKFNIFKFNTWSPPKAGVRGEATLGGHRGTVTYDAKGNRKFTALVGARK